MAPYVCCVCFVNFVPYLSFWCIEKTVIHNYCILWISSLNKFLIIRKYLPKFSYFTNALNTDFLHDSIHDSIHVYQNFHLRLSVFGGEIFNIFE